MKITITQLSVSACCALIASCEHNNAPIEAASEAVVSSEAKIPCTQAVTNAEITIGLKGNDPYFAQTFVEFRSTDVQRAGNWITLDTGDLVLSSLPGGEVPVALVFSPEALTAGYKFPPTWQESLAIVIWPEGEPKPDPVFGAPLPEGAFRAATVSPDQMTLRFVDRDNDALTYEYAIAIEGPGGRIVLDPRIKNGGVGNK